MMRTATGWLLIGSLAVMGVFFGANSVHQWEVKKSYAKNCAGITGWLESRGDFITAGNGPTDVAVLGDSYSTGDPRQQHARGWVSSLAGLRGWSMHTDGIGNTGFVNGGFCGNQQFRTRVAAIRQLNPKMLIIEGGLNDTSSSPGQVEAAADELLKSVEGIPSVVVVGPTNAPARKGIEAVDGALAKAAASNSRQYVSTIAWHLPFLPDQLHLTAAGHEEYAKRLAATLPTP